MLEQKNKSNTALQEVQSHKVDQDSIRLPSISNRSYLQIDVDNKHSEVSDQKYVELQNKSIDFEQIDNRSMRQIPFALPRINTSENKRRQNEEMKRERVNSFMQKSLLSDNSNNLPQCVTLNNGSIRIIQKGRGMKNSKGNSISSYQGINKQMKKANKENHENDLSDENSQERNVVKSLSDIQSNQNNGTNSNNSQLQSPTLNIQGQRVSKASKRALSRDRSQNNSRAVIKLKKQGNQQQQNQSQRNSSKMKGVAEENSNQLVNKIQGVQAIPFSSVEQSSQNNVEISQKSAIIHQNKFTLVQTPKKQMDQQQQSNSGSRNQNSGKQKNKSQKRIHVGSGSQNNINFLFQQQNVSGQQNINKIERDQTDQSEDIAHQQNQHNPSLCPPQSSNTQYSSIGQSMAAYSYNQRGQEPTSSPQIQPLSTNNILNPNSSKTINQTGLKNNGKERSLNKNQAIGENSQDGKQRFYNSNSVNRKNGAVQSQVENDDNPLLIFDKIDNILLKSANYSFINKENLEKDLLKLYNLENLTDQKAKQIIKQLNHSPMQILKNGLKNQSHLFRNKVINPGRVNGNENAQQGNVHKIQYISQKRYRKNGSSSSSLRRSEKGYTLGLLNTKNQNNFYSNNPQNARNSQNIKKASMISYQAKGGLNASTNQIIPTNDEDLDYQRKHGALTPQRYNRSIDKQFSPELSQNKNGSIDDTNTKPQLRLPLHEDECEELQNQNMQDKSFSSQKNEINKASINTQNSPSVKVIKMNNLLSQNMQKDISDSPSSSNKLKTEFSQVRGNQNEVQSISLNQETPTKEIEEINKRQGQHQACWDIYKINEKKQLQLKSTNLQDEMKRIDELQIKNEKAISTYIQIRQDLLDLAISQKLKQIQKGIKVLKD